MNRLQLEITLNPEATKFVKRLTNDHPRLLELQVFQRLRSVVNDSDEAFECPAEEATALSGLASLISEVMSLSNPEDRPFFFIRLADQVAATQIEQFVDYLYEARIGVLLAKRLGIGRLVMKHDESGPDWVVEYLFGYSEAPVELHIECKNVRQNSESTASNIVGQIRKAASQIERRSLSPADWLVFVDIPTSYLEENPTDHQYLHLAEYVATKLEREPWYDRGRVIFTKCFESLRINTSSEWIMRPIVTEPLFVHHVRGLFLSDFFAEPGESVNIYNFGKQSIRQDRTDLFRHSPDVRRRLENLEDNR